MAELFEYFLVVTLDTDKSPPQPDITFQFPDKITEKVITQAIPKFCFPEADELQKSVDTISNKPYVFRASNPILCIVAPACVQETFSFVSTVSDGGKRYGYCRRFLYKDKTKKPICYCLLSFCSSFSLFSQILDIVEIKFSEGDRSVYQFLHSVLAQPFPDPGATVVAKTISFTKNEKGEEDFKPEVYRMTRSDDDYEYLEYVTYTPLFDKMDIDKIIQIFECLLYERRIIICSKTLTTLSACADAIANLAYPFAWQYVFIPILPKTMLSFLGAPMPFLIGILSSYIPLIEKEPIEEEVLIVDIDENKFIRTPSVQDEIPPSLKASLQKTLKKIVKSGTRGMDFSLLIAHAFLRFFSAMFEDYNKYLGPPDHEFNLEKFSRHKTSEIRRFLNEFQNVQMYSSFIQEREMMSRKGILDQCILTRISRTELKKKIDTNVAATKHRSATNAHSATSTPAVVGDSITVNRGAPSWTAVTGPSLSRVEEMKKNKPAIPPRPTTIEAGSNAIKSDQAPPNSSFAPKVDGAHAKSRPGVPPRPLTMRPNPKARADTMVVSTAPRNTQEESEAATKTGALGSVARWLTMRSPAASQAPPMKSSQTESPVQVDDGTTASSVRPEGTPVQSPSLAAVKLRRRRSSNANLNPRRSPSDTAPVPTTENAAPADSASGTAAEAVTGTQPESPPAQQPSSVKIRESRLQRAAESLMFIDASSALAGSDARDRRSRRMGRIFQGFQPEALIASQVAVREERSGLLDEDLAVLIDNPDTSDWVIISKDSKSFFVYRPALCARIPELNPMFQEAEKDQNVGPGSLPKLRLPYSGALTQCLLLFAFADRQSFDNMDPLDDIDLLQFKSKALRRLKSGCLKWVKQRRLVRGTLGQYLTKLVHLASGAPQAGTAPLTKHTRALFDCCKLSFATKVQGTMKKFDDATLESLSPTFLVEILGLHVNKAKQTEINQSLDTLFTKYDQDNLLIDSMKNMYNSVHETGDFTLRLTDSSAEIPKVVEIRVHLGVLAVRSAFFAPLFASRTTGIKDITERISIQAWRNLIRYIYCGSMPDITTDDNMLPETIINGANFLSMNSPAFIRALQNSLCQALTPGAVFNFLSNAKSEVQKKAAYQFIAENLAKILELDKLQELPKEVLVTIMRDFPLSGPAPASVDSSTNSAN